ncbi:MAG: cytochrome c3 family protein [Planctomycetota bacterium]
MTEPAENPSFIFPKWANYLLPLVIVGVLGGAIYFPIFVNYGLGAPNLKIGYAPEQPVPFSHAVHAGKLGMDCRYCHNTVEHAAFAAVPPTQTCINCHNPQDGVNGIWKASNKLGPVWESYQGDEEAGTPAGMPVEWVTVHQLADYAYFNHAAHVNKGVSCYSCHGRVDRMEIVQTVEPLSMSWCLDCHREPENYIRPVEEVYNLAWTPYDHEIVQQAVAAGDVSPNNRMAANAYLAEQLGLVEKYQIRGTTYMTACSTCHR